MFISRSGHAPASLLAPCDTTPVDCGRAVAKVRLHGRAVIVAVSGEIDGSNSEQLSEYVHRFVPRGGALILDFTDVGFLGVQGLRALTALGEECAKAGVAWAVVAGQSLHRLLRALGRGEVLPAVASVADAAQRTGESPTTADPSGAQ